MGCVESGRWHPHSPYESTNFKRLYGGCNFWGTNRTKYTLLGNHITNDETAKSVIIRVVLDFLFREIVWVAFNV